MTFSTPIPQSKTREVISREKQSVSVSIDPADLEDLDPSRSSAFLTDAAADDDEAVVIDKADDAAVASVDEDPIGGLLRGLFGFAQVGMKLVETAGKTVQRVVQNEVRTIYIFRWYLSLHINRGGVHYFTLTRFTYAGQFRAICPFTAID